MKLKIWLLRAILIGFLCAAYIEARKTPSRRRMMHKNKADHQKNNSNTITNVSNNSKKPILNSKKHPQNTESAETDNFIAGYVAGEAAARRSHRHRTTTPTPSTTKSPCLCDGVASNENQGEYCNTFEEPTSTTKTSNAPIRRKLRRRKTTTSVPSTTNIPSLHSTELQNKNQDQEYDGIGSEIVMLSTDEPGSRNMNEDKAGVLLHNDAKLF